MYLDTRSSGSLTLDISDTEIDYCDSHGIYCESRDSNTIIDGLILDTIVSNTGDDGIYLYGYNGFFDLEFDGVDIDDTGAHGFYMNLSSCYSGTDLIFKNGTITSVLENGIHINFYRSNGSCIVTNNTISLAENGIYLTSNDYGYTAKALIAGNTIHTNSDDGIECYTSSSSNQYLEIIGNNIYQNIGNGIYFSRYNSSSSKQYPVVAFNTLNNNGGSGIRSDAYGSSAMPYNNLFDNILYAIYNMSASSIDARFCTWSASVITEMQADSGAYKNIAAIYDVFDDSTSGSVNYLQWQGSPVDISSGLVSRLTDPLDGSTYAPGLVVFKGVAYADNDIDKVEISVDNGNTWAEVTYDSGFISKSSWEYSAEIFDEGPVTVMTRVTDIFWGRGVTG